MPETIDNHICNCLMGENLYSVNVFEDQRESVWKM